MLKLSACVIAKNEEKNIKQWLKSICQIATEMIVVDTGSLDQTVTLAKSAGAKVYSYVWNNDFAAAKNFAMSKAQEEWILFLDADEYFSKNTIQHIPACIAAIHENKKIDALICSLINVDADEDNRYIGTSKIVRIFRRDRSLCYAGKIHETLVRKGGVLRLAEPDQAIEVYHTGYSSGVIKSKLERNFKILQEEIAATGEKRRHYVYLLDCYYGLKDYEKAVQYAKKCIEEKVAPFGQESMVYRRWIDSLVFSNANESDVLAVVEMAIHKYPELPEFYWNKGKFLFDQKDYIEAENCLRKAVALKKLGKSKGASGTFETKLTFLYYLLGEISRRKGNIEEALTFLLKSLELDRYNKAALEALYRSIRLCDTVDIIEILQHLYSDKTEREIEFMISVLGQYPVDKVYLYYAQLLQKNFQCVSAVQGLAGFFAAGKYEEAIVQSIEQVKESYQWIIISTIISKKKQNYDVAKALLSYTYGKVLDVLMGKSNDHLFKDEYAIYKNIKKEIKILHCSFEDKGKMRDTIDEEKTFEKSTSIVVVTHGNIKETKQCIESIRTYTNVREIEIILVDNASDEAMISWLRQQRDILLISNKENRGYVKAINQGIAAARGQEVLVMHNDVVVTEGWLDKLRQALYRDSLIGAVAPVSYGAYEKQQIPVIVEPYETMEQMQVTANRIASSVEGREKYRQNLFLQDFCLLLKREVIDAVGWFDEDFSPAFFEDRDYSLRILQAGYRLMVVRDVFVHHTQGLTFSDMEMRKKIKQDNFEKFKVKWKFNPLYSAKIREDLLVYLDLKRSDSTVLDIGCACGGNLMRMKEINPLADVYGVEIDENAARIAACFGTILNENIETLDKVEWLGKFDYILLGDVLEHLKDTAKTLKNLHGMLKPRGCIIASIPNIMHISVMEALLKGRWHYEDTEIPDRTNLRFFTKIEIQTILKKAGFSVLEMAYTVVELTEKQRRLKEKVIEWEGTIKEEEQFDAYEWIAFAQKEEEVSINEIEPAQTALIYFLKNMENEIAAENLLSLLNKQKINMEIVLSWIVQVFKEEVKPIIDFAVFLYKNGKMTDGVALIEAAYKRKPEDADLVYAFVFLLHACGEDEKAGNVLQKTKEVSDELAILAKEIIV